MKKILWDGFTAYWSIVQDVLCLDSIRCEHYNANCREYIGERIPNDTLLRVFKNYVDGKHIVANWLTGDIINGIKLSNDETEETENQVFGNIPSLLVCLSGLSCGWSSEMSGIG